MAWVACNKLDADQARLVWWGDGSRKPGGSARDAEQLLGDFLCGRTLYFLDRSGDGGHIYVISDGLDSEINRIIVALVPNKDSAFGLGELRLGLPEGAPKTAWTVEAIQFSASNLPVKTVLPVVNDGAGLQVSIGKSATEPMRLLLRQPETGGASK